MAHLTVRPAYKKLSERINRYPQGAPPAKTLFRILELLFSETEADLVARLPIKPFTTKKAARLWQKTDAEAKKILDKLAGRGVLVDSQRENGMSVYFLPPPMAGFFEFSMMRLRTDIDQKLLAELFYQYLNVEEEFIKQLFCDGETQLGRVFVHETALSPENSLHVLDYERASEIAKTSHHISVGICYCRHKMEHVGRACSADQDICLTFNNTAAALARHGIARRIDVAECLDLLQKARGQNLVQFGENVRRSVNFICNCCGCCCEAMIAARRFGFLHPVHTSNFIAVIDETACSGCGRCVDACPVEAMALVTANDPKLPKRKVARLLNDLCLGCAVCVAACPQTCIALASRPQRVITPLDSTHRAVVMAIERGKLQNLIFDVQAHWNHRAMAAILGVILRLPPLKQAMASRQMKSRYLEYLLEKLRY
ncbi:MAG: 4Fe-4S dicluster domain-containing protein [Candidatus Aminicenantes bacterium]|nr:4Fe-4S dicluster domain-containing protein [Candidatus Aminicenantes bacterium]